MCDNCGVANFTLGDVAKALSAEIVCGQDKIDSVVKTACGCDLMSDVLAFTQPGSVLLTGLTNQQVVRTAEMLDLTAVIIVRNKRPDDITIELAQKKGLPILLSPYPLYESCGLLYSMGLMGCKSSGKSKQQEARKRELETPTQMPCGALWWGD